MKLSTRSEYALISLIELAKYYPEDKFFRLDDINANLHIPKKYLEGIFYTLKSKNIITTKRGFAGGYKLAKNPSQISIAEIVRALDGALAPSTSVSEYFYQTSPMSQNNSLVKFFKSIRDSISERMESTTLSDFLTD